VVIGKLFSRFFYLIKERILNSSTICHALANLNQRSFSCPEKFLTALIDMAAECLSTYEPGQVVSTAMSVSRLDANKNKFHHSFSQWVKAQSLVQLEFRLLCKIRLAYRESNVHCSEILDSIAEAVKTKIESGSVPSKEDMKWLERSFDRETFIESVARR